MMAAAAKLNKARCCAVVSSFGRTVDRHSATLVHAAFENLRQGRDLVRLTSPTPPHVECPCHKYDQFILCYLPIEPFSASRYFLANTHATPPLLRNTASVVDCYDWT